MNKRILKALMLALKAVKEPRFYRTERGYQGRLFCALQAALEERLLLKAPFILEMEYQKSALVHGTKQRPDIVLHAPAEDTGSEVHVNNRAVFALKRKATVTDVREDFRKLDDMCRRLSYPLAVFINLDSDKHHLAEYQGEFQERIHAFCTRLRLNRIEAVHAWFLDGETTERSF